MILKDLASNPELRVRDPAELRSQDQELSGVGGVGNADVLVRKKLEILGHEDSRRQVRVLRDHPVGALHIFKYMMKWCDNNTPKK